MAYSVVPLDRLTEQFERLPGIGHKTAARLAYYMISRSELEVQDFSTILLEAKKIFAIANAAKI